MAAKNSRCVARANENIPRGRRMFARSYLRERVVYGKSGRVFKQFLRVRTRSLAVVSIWVR